MALLFKLCILGQASVVASVQFSSVTQSCPTLCNPMNRSKPGLPVHHRLPEFTQTHVHQVSDAIQPSHPLSSPSPPPPIPPSIRVFSNESFFLELFLHWSPVAYWTPTDLGSSSFSILSFCLFTLFMGFSGKNTEVVCHSLLQWTTFCQTSPPWPTCLGWPHGHGLVSLS